MRIRTTACLLVSGLALGACSSSTEAGPIRGTVFDRPIPEEAPADAFPLTGEPTDDPRFEQPVVAVKIENTSSARPQAGLDAADIVYEEIVEGGVTRFAALFHSELPAEVGPVRSARLVDVDILGPWGSLLVYSGAREDVTSTLARADLIGLFPDAGPPAYSRAPDRPGSHDLMADLTVALDVAGELPDLTPAPAPFTFAEEVPEDGTAGSELEIAMSSSSRTGWEYDEAEGVYRRLQDGEPSVVTGDGVIGAANVVVILTDVGPGGCCDTAGSRFTATRFDGEGDAVLLRDGQRYDIRWRKPSATRHLELVDTSGTVVPLRPGATWIHLAPVGAVPEPGASDDASEAPSEG